MTPTELRDTLNRLELGPTQAANMLGVDPRTMRRWLAGERDITPSVIILLRLIEAVPGAKEWLKEHFADAG